MQGLGLPLERTDAAVLEAQPPTRSRTVLDTTVSPASACAATGAATEASRTGKSTNRYAICSFGPPLSSDSWCR